MEKTLIILPVRVHVMRKTIRFEEDWVRLCKKKKTGGGGGYHRLSYSLTC